MKTARFARLTITNMAELEQQERTIIARIEKVPNGGKLYMAHPFQLLEDINVRMSPAVRKHILVLHPELASLSGTPYNALKMAGHQNITYRLHGLFRRGKP